MTDKKKKNILELTRMTPEECRASGKLPLMVLLDNVRSLNNVGAILRTADAFSVQQVVMCGITGTPPSAEIHKTALGAEDSVVWRHAPYTIDEVRRLQKEGWHVCALEQTHNSIPLQNFRVEPGKKYAIIPGNEVQGVEQEVVYAADSVIEIPQEGAKHSLNVSVSTGIALWHFFTALRNYGLPDNV